MSDPQDWFIRDAEKKMERYLDKDNMAAYLRVKKQRDRMVRDKPGRTRAPLAARRGEG